MTAAPPDPGTTAAIILAAGASRRLGQPKQTAVVGGERLLDRAVRTASESGCTPLVVVLGAAAEEIASVCDLRRAWVVVNSGWEEGMGSSVRAGVELLAGMPEVSGTLLMTSDMPEVTPEHLQALRRDPGSVAASEYGGRRGVPAYVPRSAFPALHDLRGDAGARELLQAARAVELHGAEIDVDTPEDLERVRAKAEPSRP